MDVQCACIEKSMKREREKKTRHAIIYLKIDLNVFAKVFAYGMIVFGYSWLFIRSRARTSSIFPRRIYSCTILRTDRLTFFSIFIFGPERETEREEKEKKERGVLPKQ